MRGPLSMADVEAFKRDGVVVLRRAFDPAPYASAAVDELHWNMEQEPRKRRYHLIRAGSARFDVIRECPRVHAAVAQLVRHMSTRRPTRRVRVGVGRGHIHS